MAETISRIEPDSFSEGSSLSFIPISPLSLVYRVSNPSLRNISTAWCEFVGSFGGTPAASRTSGRAGSSRSPTMTVHFAPFLVQRKLLAARTTSARVSSLGLRIKPLHIHHIQLIILPQQLIGLAPYLGRVTDPRSARRLQGWPRRLCVLSASRTPRRSERMATASLALRPCRRAAFR